MKIPSFPSVPREVLSATAVTLLLMACILPVSRCWLASWFAPPQDDAMDTVIHMKSQLVHMVWSTPADTFGERQFAVIDSLFFHSPYVCLIVYSNSLTPKIFHFYAEQKLCIRIQRYDKEFFLTLVPEESAPARQWVSEWSKWKTGQFFYSHMTDLLRFSVIYKHGGTYMDFDALTLNTWGDTIRNGVGVDESGATGGDCSWCLDKDGHYIAPGVMINFQPGLPAILQALRAFDASIYDPKCFNCVGPKAITLAAKRLMGQHGFTLLPTHVLYPYNWQNIKTIFRPPAVHRLVNRGLLEHLQDHVLSLHLFGHVTGKLKIAPGSLVEEVIQHNSIRCTDVVGPWGLVCPQALFINQFDFTLLSHVRIRSCSTEESHVHVLVTSSHTTLRRGINESLRSFSTLKCSGSVHSCNTFLARLVVGLDRSDSPIPVSWQRVEITVSSQDDSQSCRVHVGTVEHIMTVASKTMGRSDKVQRLVRSLRVLYPRLPMLIADDGPVVNVRSRYDQLYASDPMTSYVDVPFDAGLSLTRNMLLLHVVTDLVFLVDDDFIFNWGSNLLYLLRRMRAGTYDIMGAIIPSDIAKWHFMFRGGMSVQNGSLFLTPRISNVQNECERVDYVVNVFLGRVDSILSVRWDDRLKLGEHEDFFWRAKHNNLRVVNCPAVHFKHLQSAHWQKKTWYDLMRQRVWGFFLMVLKKHGWKSMVVHGIKVIEEGDTEKAKDFESGCSVGTIPPECKVCKEGYTGAFCADCLPGYFGPRCTKCACQGKECSDGLDGSGKCDEYVATFQFPAV